MASLRTLLLGALLGAPALAAERPSAVQVCFSLPDGVALFASSPRPNYRALDDGALALDLDLKLNGRLPDRVTRMGGSCVRAWLQPVSVVSIEVSFDRTVLALAAQEKRVDLKLKPDLWYDGGQVAVAHEPWARVTTVLPGLLTLQRLSGDASVEVPDHQQLPAGRYRVRYEAPPAATGACRVTLRATGVGTIRPDNRPELYARLVESYRTEWLPEVARAQKLTCTRAEALEVAVRMVDGAFHAPLDPVVTRVRVPEQEPRYQLLLEGKTAPFESGQVITLGPGQELVLEAVDLATVAAAP
jgi:hypothetical protein